MGVRKLNVIGALLFFVIYLPVVAKGGSMPVSPIPGMLPFLVTGIGTNASDGTVLLSVGGNGWLMDQAASGEKLTAHFCVTPGMPANIKVSPVIRHVGVAGDVYYNFYLYNGADGEAWNAGYYATGWIPTTLDTESVTTNAVLPSVNMTVAEGDILTFVFSRAHSATEDTFEGTAYLVGFLIEEQ